MKIIAVCNQLNEMKKIQCHKKSNSGTDELGKDRKTTDSYALVLGVPSYHGLNVRSIPQKMNLKGKTYTGNPLL